MRDPDFQPILKYKPTIDFTWSYTTAGGLITREQLPASMRLRKLGRKNEPCVQTYNGPIVLPDGTVLICSCVAAVDGEKGLRVGNVISNNLLEIWRSEKVKAFRSEFVSASLNATCQKCDMCRGLELYKTREGRGRAKINGLRAAGQIIKRKYNKTTPFMGG